MKGYCPACGKETELRLIRKPETFNVRGEEITVEVEFYECQECGEEFEDPQSDYDPVEVLYQEYRKRKSMLLPDEIREFRDKFDLTQHEFSKLLGIGIATLNRYENGALQSEANDRLIRYAMAPENLLKLIEDHPQALPDEKRELLLCRIKEELDHSSSLMGFLNSLYGNYEPDLYSGNKELDIKKFFSAIHFLCEGERVFKTKLTKLLFYSDFEHFRRYGFSMTGSRYAHLPHGPVPDQFDVWFGALIEIDPSIQVEEVDFGEYVGERYYCQEPSDLSIFTSQELVVLSVVKEKFKSFSAKRIREYSHQEKAYQETQNGQLISYSFANELR